MFRSSSCAVSLITAIVVITAVTLSQAHVKNTRAGHELEQFRHRVAGGWFEFDGSIGPSAFQGLHTVGADGTHVGNNTFCCNMQGPAWQSTAHGVWHRTADRQITVTTLIFGLAPTEGDPEGNHDWTARVTAVIDFDACAPGPGCDPLAPFETATASLRTWLFPPSEDPTAAGAIPLFPDPFTSEVDWKRIHVMD